MAGSNVTVGIDIGTSSVKAIAADDDGNVVARARIPHDFYVPSPQRFEHDAAVAWHDGPQRALEALGDVDAARGVGRGDGAVAHRGRRRGVPVTPGLLYGDERGHQEKKSDQPERGELAQFLRWQAHERPDARGYWMAQAVANHALSGRGEHLVHRRRDRGRALRLERGLGRRRCSPSAARATTRCR